MNITDGVRTIWCTILFLFYVSVQNSSANVQNVGSYNKDRNNTNTDNILDAINYFHLLNVLHKTGKELHNSSTSEFHEMYLIRKKERYNF